MTRTDDLRTRIMNRPMSRRALLRNSAVAGAGVLGMSIFGPRFAAFNFTAPIALAAQLDSDLDVLNYALTLEYLEAAAYKAMNDAGVLSGRAATYFKAFGQHEMEHVQALVTTIQSLGGAPVAMPSFDFSTVPTDPADIVKFFQTVEATGASAYHGAAPSIKNPDVLTAALQIHSNEAEHAAALADLVAPGTGLFSPAAFATPRTPEEVLAIVAPFLPSGTGGGNTQMPSTGGGGMARHRTSAVAANRR